MLALHLISLPRAVNGSLTVRIFRTTLNTLGHSTTRILCQNAMSAIVERPGPGVGVAGSSWRIAGADVLGEGNRDYRAENDD